MGDKKYVSDSVSLTPKGKWCVEQSNRGKTEAEKMALWIKATNECELLFDKDGKPKIN